MLKNRLYYGGLPKEEMGFRVQAKRNRKRDTITLTIKMSFLRASRIQMNYRLRDGGFMEHGPLFPTEREEYAISKAIYNAVFELRLMHKLLFKWWKFKRLLMSALGRKVELTSG